MTEINRTRADQYENISIDPIKENALNFDTMLVLKSTLLSHSCRPNFDTIFRLTISRLDCATFQSL